MTDCARTDAWERWTAAIDAREMDRGTRCSSSEEAEISLSD
jgi:hypothetical protein